MHRFCAHIGNSVAHRCQPVSPKAANTVRRQGSGHAYGMITLAAPRDSCAGRRHTASAAMPADPGTCCSAGGACARPSACVNTT